MTQDIVFDIFGVYYGAALFGDKTVIIEQPPTVQRQGGDARSGSPLVTCSAQPAAIRTPPPPNYPVSDRVYSKGTV